MNDKRVHIDCGNNGDCVIVSDTVPADVATRHELESECRVAEDVGNVNFGSQEHIVQIRTRICWVDQEVLCCDLVVYVLSEVCNLISRQVRKLGVGRCECDKETDIRSSVRRRCDGW
jgi:hypothetical protein